MYLKRLQKLADDLAGVETVSDLIDIMSKLVIIHNEMSDIAPTEEESQLLDWLMGAVMNLRA